MPSVLRDPLRQLALERLFDEGPVYAWLTDVGGRTIWASESWLAFSGRGPEGDLASSWAEHVHRDDLERTRAGIGEAFAARRPFSAEYRLRSADGAWRTIVTHGVPYQDERGEFAGHVGLNFDHTELHDTQVRAQAIAQQLETILGHLRVGVFTVDAAGRYRYMNREWESRITASPWSGVGQNLAEFFPPDVAATIRADNDQVVRDPAQRIEKVVTVPTLDGPTDFLVQTLRIVDTDGATPLVCGVATDISHVRRAERERRRYEARRLQSQRLESLGLLAGGIAHDFNNLLQGIVGSVELALPHLPDDSPAQAALAQVVQAARAGAELSGKMLAYTGRGLGAFAPLDLARLVRDERAILRAALPLPIAFESEIAGPLPAIEGDHAQIRQALLHLVTNAGEAIGAAPGRVTLVVRAAELGREQLDDCTLGERCEPGAFVALEVRDDGPGMDAETRARAFDPFYSTRLAGRGLGLPVVLGTMRSHGGALRLESEPGRGTTVRLWLPAASGRAATPPAPAPPSEARRTVLVVDDEEPVRNLVRTALSRSGYPVLTAADGLEALEVWSRHGGEIGLVIADLTMPRLDGRQLLAELRARGADVAVVLASGYDATDRADGHAPADATRFLAKPFSVADLVACVRAALGQPDAAR